MLSFLSSVLICSVIALVLGAESEVHITKYSVRDVSSLTSRILISSPFLSRISSQIFFTILSDLFFIILVWW